MSVSSMCQLLINVSVWHLLFTDPCQFLIHVGVWHVSVTDPCRCLACVSY